jgi:ribonuclease R
MATKSEAALDAILARQGVHTDYPAEVLQEVDALMADPGIDDPGLEDLTALPFVTIDNEDSRDLDQALQIERCAGGRGFIVRYALADAAHFVRPESALFAEALERGVSYYLPGRCVPMLPPRLSEGIVSLNPNVPRRALVFVMKLDDRGLAVETTLVRARIRSRAKLTYIGVQGFYDGPAVSALAGQDYTESLELLQTVGLLRIEDARQRDVVQFNRVEVEVYLEPSATGGGDGFAVHKEERSLSSCYNEQISLLCNMEGARLLAEAAAPEVQAVYRVHAAPDGESLDHLKGVIDDVVAVHGLEPRTYAWRRGAESLADYLERLPTSSVDARLRSALERQVLMTNRRSVFSAEPGRHFALGVSPYSRFSSPMREVVGIFTHKEALELLGLAPARGERGQDEAIRKRVISAANRSKERQRSLTKAVTRLCINDLLKRDLDLPQAERSVYRGTILGIRPTRLYVGLDAPPVELKVYVEDLEAHAGVDLEIVGEGARLAPAGQGGGPSYRLGDPVELKVQGRSKRGKWRLMPC